MSDFQYRDNNSPKVQEAIAGADELESKFRQLRVAYKALEEYRDEPRGNPKYPDVREGSPIFNSYFAVVPAADPTKRLEDTIRHGLIITLPNVKDADLLPEQLAAREGAVKYALEAVRKDSVKSTRNDLVNKYSGRDGSGRGRGNFDGDKN